MRLLEMKCLFIVDELWTKTTGNGSAIKTMKAKYQKLKQKADVQVHPLGRETHHPYKEQFRFQRDTDLRII